LIGRLLRAGITYAILAVAPALASNSAVPANTVHWQGGGVVTWEAKLHRPIAPQTMHRLDFALAPGASKVIAHGAPGERELVVRYWQRDGGPVRHSVLASTVIEAPRARIVAEGIGQSPLSSFEARGVLRMSYIARSALQMIATAYTADCAGCGGTTRYGRAGHGIVAVDPRVIPMGTRLFIPGYGFAIAGDTGGDIRGDRIDLGFDSDREAMLFGRRDVTVYRLGSTK
jgi:3D (Asp-Asp-Asp) domain-containing protein